MSREMKNSGIQWIGSIPSNWKLLRNRYIFSKEKEIVGERWSKAQLLSLTTSGIKTRSTDDVSGKVPESYDGYQLVRAGQMVMCLFDLDCSAVFSGLSPIDGMISPAYCVLNCHDIMIPKFADYWFRFVFDGRKYNTYSKNIRFSLPYDDFREVLTAVPPVPEQHAIVRYLDSKCSAIDEAIERHKKIIEKLEEYKKATIRQLVIGGTDKTVEMKPSRVNWCSKVPSHWKMKKIKYVFTIRKRIAGREGITVLSITQKGIVPKDITSGEGQLAESYSNYQIVNPGDFAMNHMDLLTGWVDISKYYGVTSPDYRVFTLDDTKNNEPRYFLYMMQMFYFNRVFYSLGAGISGLGRWRLQAPVFNNFKIPVPPYEEQLAIADKIEKAVVMVEEAVTRHAIAIEKLEEYRKSIIYNAVTGKIDCCIGASS